MYKTKTISIITGLLLLLSACAPEAVPEPTLTPTPTATFPQKITISTRAHTQTSIAPTPTPTVTATPTPTPTWLKKNCIEVVRDIPSDHGFEGVLVLMGGIAEYTPTHLMNLKTGVITLLEKENENISSAEVSPNGKWLALVKSTWDSGSPDSNITKSIIILDANGEQKQEIAWYDDYSNTIPLWFDNEHLLITSFQDKESGYILNPFSKELNTISLIFPDQFLPHTLGYLLEYHKNVNGVFIDPTMSLAVYANSSGSHFVFWDLLANQEIKRIPFNSSIRVPKWSQNGEFIIVVARHIKKKNSEEIWNEELFSVSREGQVTQLTHLSTFYTSGNIIRGYNLSPDGRYIAFWLGVHQGSLPSGVWWEWELAIYDMVTGEVILTCIRNEEWPTYSPIWAKNSRQVMIDFPTGEFTNHIILVDITRAFAVIITENKEIFGWMTAPQ